MMLANARGTIWRLTPDMRLSRTWSGGERPDRLALAKQLLGSLVEQVERG